MNRRYAPSVDQLKSVVASDLVTFYRDLGFRLQGAIDAEGWTLKKVAEMSHYSLPFLSRLINGEITYPGPYARCFLVIGRRISAAPVPR